jgi:RNA polymerase sigma factor (TIGR02999 family)
MANPQEHLAPDVTHILNAIRNGDAHAGDQLMSAVYAELRRIAGGKMAREQPGHTLQATALVHEAWLRLGEQTFENRAHFYAAAAEAMRRILVESARRKASPKHGAGAEHCDVGNLEIASPIANDGELLAVHEALAEFAQHDARNAELVKLRYFAGLSFEETAEVLGVSVRTAKRDWNYARAWLRRAISAG